MMLVNNEKRLMKMNTHKYCAMTAIECNNTHQIDVPSMVPTLVFVSVPEQITTIDVRLAFRAATRMLPQVDAKVASAIHPIF
jgi:hypothetical protein